MVEPGAEQQWRVVVAWASVIFGLLGLVVLAVVLVANRTFWLGSRDVDINAVIPGGFVALAGVVTGFLGRNSRQRRAAVVGSLLSWGALLGVGWASFMVPYEPGINDLAWSPDGTRIAYAHTWASAGGEDGIWLVSADGSSEPTRLIGSGSSPTWSPDGTSIAYVASVSPDPRGDPNGDLWLMDPDGGSAHQVTQFGAHDGAVGGLSWSPDGSRITFDTFSPEGKGPEGVWIVDADGANLRRISGGSAPRWSPDGTQIAFGWAPSGEGSEGVWIVDADGANSHRIADGSAPGWSPDGTQIVHTTYPGQGPWNDWWVVNADGTGRTKLPGENHSRPTWTSDGRLTVDCPEGLCVMDADGANRSLVLAGDEGTPLAYDASRIPSPDGTRVAYVTRAGIKSDIVVTTIDGSSRITLVQ